MLSLRDRPYTSPSKGMKYKSSTQGRIVVKMMFNHKPHESVHRMLFNKRPPTACWCNHSQNCIRTGWTSEVVVYMQLMLTKVLQWSSIGLVPINKGFYLSFSIALVPQLQLRHFRWSVSAQSAGDVHSQVLDFPLSGRLCANCRKTLTFGGHRPDNVPCIPVHQHQIDYYITACHITRGVFRDHSITTMLKSVLLHLTVTCTSETKRFTISDVYNIFGLFFKPRIISWTACVWISFRPLQSKIHGRKGHEGRVDA